jgi:hypothetical protein
MFYAISQYLYWNGQMGADEIVLLGIDYVERSFEMRENLLRVFHWDLPIGEDFSGALGCRHAMRGAAISECNMD